MTLLSLAKPTAAPPAMAIRHKLAVGDGLSLCMGTGYKPQGSERLIHIAATRLTSATIAPNATEGRCLTHGESDALINEDRLMSPRDVLFL